MYIDNHYWSLECSSHNFYPQGLSETNKCIFQHTEIPDKKARWHWPCFIAAVFTSCWIFCHDIIIRFFRFKGKRKMIKKTLRKRLQRYINFNPIFARGTPINRKHLKDEIHTIIFKIDKIYYVQEIINV